MTFNREFSKIRTIFMAAVFFAGLFILSPVHAESYRVAFVYDGDTILLQNGVKVRYLGIDTPEIDQENGNDEPFSHDARDLNRELGQRKDRYP